jgi:hypothetical protein
LVHGLFRKIYSLEYCQTANHLWVQFITEIKQNLKLYFMKKIIFTLLIAFASGLAFTSCTEEEIAPTTENGGATFGDAVKRT